MRLKIQEYDCTYGDNPSLIHCPVYKPCMKHELEQKYKRAVEHGTDEESQKWTAIKERDEALQELKYLHEHMENAGGDNWADAETHEIRSYLRSIVRGCKIKV